MHTMIRSLLGSVLAEESSLTLWYRCHKVHTVLWFNQNGHLEKSDKIDKGGVP
jgi:hypothetical protein